MPIQPRFLRGATPRAGFTLIEILAVVLIIAVLAAALVPSLLGASESVGISSTRTLIGQISSEIEAYENEAGDYPPSAFPGSLDPKPSETNMGAEMLLIALMPADGSYRAATSYEDHLGNTDGDATKTPLARFKTGDAFELHDHWGNPIAYFHRRDYESSCDYRAYVDLEGEWVEQSVRGVQNPKTGEPYRPDTFQLISAGPDGVFGSEDDVANFEAN